MQLSFLITAVTVFAGSLVRAEQHTIRFKNKCGKGTPQLVQGGKILSSGGDFVSKGPFMSGIAYLQTGDCLLNGEHCTLVEMTLGNPTVPGGGSSSDISLIPPHKFNVPASFSYFGGCEGQGAACNGPTCNTAFFIPDDNQVQVGCQANDVNLLITFCDGTTNSSTPEVGGSKPLPTSTHTQTSKETPKASPVLPHTASPSSSAPVTAHTSTHVAAAPTSADTDEGSGPSAVKNVASASPMSTPPTCRVGGARHRRRHLASH